MAEAFSPGACVARVARQYDVSTALVYTWRRKACLEAGVAGAAASAQVGFVEASSLMTEAASRYRRRRLLWWICLVGGA
ncbi:transposase [Novosphingobium sp. ST904]|uniref:transposase n=1 Tax=Novosphingobium sp. ST904 TaxID=1684385 RepID=UPI001E5CDEDA|nr:transposase [Novosphingobium sp. ST904]